MKDKDEDGVLDKRIERDDGVPMEAKKANERNGGGDENLGEYEEELDWTGRKSTKINIDTSDKNHEKDEEGLEAQAREEQEQQQRHEGFIEEETKYGEEQEEEEFEEEEINEDKQRGENQLKQREEQEEEKEEEQEEQNYETNAMHVQDEKYRKENAETKQENDYFPLHRYEEEDEAEDPDKGGDEQEGQVQGKKQEQRNQSDEQGKQDGQDESEGVEEHDDNEEDNYRKLINQSEGLKSEQRQDTQREEKEITQQYKASMKQDNIKEVSMFRTQAFKMADDLQEENKGVPVNNMKRNDDLTVRDEDHENRGKSSHEHDDLTVQDKNQENRGRGRQDDKMTKDVPSTQIAQLEGSNGTQSAMVETQLGTTKITSTNKDGEGDGAGFQDKESRDGTKFRDNMASRTYGEGRRQNIFEMNTERKERRGERAEEKTKMEERVELQADQVRTEGDVKLKENGYSTETSETNENKTTINREAEQEGKATKSTESAKQGPGETEKVSKGPEVSYQ